MANHRLPLTCSCRHTLTVVDVGFNSDGIYFYCCCMFCGNETTVFSQFERLIGYAIRKEQEKGNGHPKGTEHEEP